MTQWPSRQQFDNLETRTANTELALGNLAQQVSDLPAPQALLQSKPTGGTTYASLDADNAYSAFSTAQTVLLKAVRLTAFGLTTPYPAELLIFADMGVGFDPPRPLRARIPMYFAQTDGRDYLVAEMPSGMKLVANQVYFFGVTTSVLQSWSYLQLADNYTGAIQAVQTDNTYTASAPYAAPDVAAQSPGAALPFEFFYTLP